MVGETSSEKILKHRNTDWRLVMHENGTDAPIKPLRSHYGARVTSNAGVDRATEYELAKLWLSSCYVNIRRRRGMLSAFKR